MISIWKRVALGLSALLLIGLLAACGGSGTASTNNAPVLKLFKGVGFTIKYPENWHQQADGDQATFADSVNRDIMAVFSDDNPSNNSASDIANQAWANFMKTLLVNPQPVSVSPTYSLAGTNWVQLSATGILSTDPGVQGNFFLLVATHQANSYEIEYYGPSSTFDQANQEFGTMLQSFQFAKLGALPSRAMTQTA